MKKSIILTSFLLIGAVLSLIFLLMIIESLQGKIESSSGQETDVKQLVMEFSSGKRKDVLASITSRELILTKENREKEIYLLPEDEFFVSIAPYIEGTHPCAIHNLTTCQGELPLEEFDVYIKDSEGNVILDQSVKSYPNGFIDLWLPRNKTYQVTIEYNGKTAKTEISTFDDSNTCITTMQLS